MPEMGDSKDKNQINAATAEASLGSRKDAGYENDDSLDSGSQRDSDRSLEQVSRPARRILKQFQQVSAVEFHRLEDSKDLLLPKQKKGFVKRHLSQNHAIVKVIQEEDSEIDELLADVDEGSRRAVYIEVEPPVGSRDLLCKLSGPVSFCEQ